MKRHTDYNAPCLLGTILTGPTAAIALQEGAKLIGGILGLVFAALFVVGIKKMRVYYTDGTGRKDA